MNAYIEAIAPTINQLGSLNNFGIPNRQVGNGCYIALKETDSVADAEKGEMTILGAQGYV